MHPDDQQRRAVTRDQQDFIAALRDLVEHPAAPLGQDPVWVGGQPSPDGAVVLYRQREGLPVLGYRVDLVAFAPLFGPEVTMVELAQIVYVNDICPPAGRGVRKSVTWADGLVQDPGAIEWVYGS